MGRIHRMTIHLLGMRTAPAAVFTPEVCQDHAKPSGQFLGPVFSATNCGLKLLWVCDLALAVPVSDAVLECQETTKCRKATNCRLVQPGEPVTKARTDRLNSQKLWVLCSVLGNVSDARPKSSGVVFLCLCAYVWKAKQHNWACPARLTARPRNP
jgi:hypothetical protein